MPATRRYGIVLAVTLLTFLYEAWGSYLTNSKGILADATHMLGDGIPFFLGFIAERKATTKKRRGELAAIIRKFNFVFLAAAAAYMCAAGLLRLFAPVPIESSVLYFAMVGIAGNAVQLYFAHGFERTQILHLAADLAGSIGVVIGSILVVYLGLLRADSVATLIVGAVTAWAAYECTRGGHGHSHAGHSHDHHGHTH